ncbi:MAG TPA: AAA family ATPase [Frankiaceae bacterium]|nr:AAA family ATPase [Frankiaceae bacterium]
MTTRHLERVELKPRREIDRARWPYTIPAVAQVIDEGLDVPAGVTFLVGENGSGKSTLVEAMAHAYPRRGVENPYVNLLGDRGRPEDSPLGWDLRAVTHGLASPAGFFLRAETMHQVLGEADAAESQRRAWGGERVQERSHGESFLAILRHRFTDPGVYFLDEPEAALSFRSCLGLIALLDTMRREGSQVVCATHSPLLVSLPGATLLEVGEWGLREAAYDDLDLVRSWREFLDAPGRWLRHLVDQD